MKTGELRGVLVSFADFERNVRSECYGELERFIDVVPPKGTESTAAFVKRVKARLDGGKVSAPQSLVRQLNAIRALLTFLGAKKSLREDIAHIQELLASSTTADMDTLVMQLEAARDYVAPPATPRRRGTRGGTARGSSAKAVVDTYVKRLEQAALRPAEFEAILKELKSQTSLADDKVKQIANKLHPSPSKSPLRPKSREDAFRRILEYQHRKAHSESSRRALELTPL
jgi:hypothetical protein